MNHPIDKRRFAIVLVSLLTLAGCASANSDFDYGFESADGLGTWRAGDHESATIRIQEDGRFDAELPASLCREDRPSVSADVDWTDRVSLTGEWRTFENSSYSGYLAPEAACPFIPIYFQRNSSGEQSMIIYLVADEDAGEENVVRFLRTDGDDADG
jgi:hypothetical protein